MEGNFALDSVGNSKPIPAEYEKRLDDLKLLYPDKRSAVMPALYLTQEHYGHITKEGIEWVAERLQMPPIHVLEVATFYTMYYKRPVGKYHIQVCRTLSCSLRGARKITERLRQRFGIEPNQVSGDGLWSYEEVECLGSCGTAPMCEINDTYFENLSAEKIDQIIDRIEREKPDLRFSTLKDELGEGLKGHSKSEVVK